MLQRNSTEKKGVKIVHTLPSYMGSWWFDLMLKVRSGRSIVEKFGPRQHVVERRFLSNIDVSILHMQIQSSKLFFQYSLFVLELLK